MVHYGNSFMALGMTCRLMSPSSTSLGLSLSLNLNPRSPIIHWLFLPKCLASTISKAMGSYWALFSLLKAYFLLHFFRFHQLYWPPTLGLWIFFDSSFTCTLDTPSAAQVFLVVPLNHRCPSFPHAMVMLAQTYIFLLLWDCRCLLSAKWPFFLLFVLLLLHHLKRCWIHPLKHCVLVQCFPILKYSIASWHLQGESNTSPKDSGVLAQSLQPPSRIRLLQPLTFILLHYSSLSK